MLRGVGTHLVMFENYQHRLKELLAICRGIGFEFVELDQTIMSQSPQHISDLLIESGMQLLSLQVGFQQLLTEESLTKVSRFVADVGAMALTVMGAADDTEAGAFERTIAACNHAAMISKNNGHRFLYHGMASAYRLSNDGTCLLDHLSMYTSSTDVSFTLDTLWMRVAGRDPVEIIKRFGHRCGCLHVKTGEGSQRPECLAYRPLQSGLDVDIATCLSAYHQFCPNACIVAEQDECNGDPESDLHTNRTFLRDHGF